MLAALWKGFAVPWPSYTSAAPANKSRAANQPALPCGRATLGAGAGLGAEQAQRMVKPQQRSHPQHTQLLAGPEGLSSTPAPILLPSLLYKGPRAAGKLSSPGTRSAPHAPGCSHSAQANKSPLGSFPPLLLEPTAVSPGHPLLFFPLTKGAPLWTWQRMQSTAGAASCGRAQRRAGL